MAKRSPFEWRQVWAAGAAGLLFLLAGSALAQKPDAPPGPEVCQGCHADHVASYQSTIHSKTGNPRSPASAGGCVACHAGAAEHVKAGGGRGAGGIVNPASKSLSADEKSGVCLNCHSTNRHLEFWPPASTEKTKCRATTATTSTAIAHRATTRC